MEVVDKWREVIRRPTGEEALPGVMSGLILRKMVEAVAEYTYVRITGEDIATVSEKEARACDAVVNVLNEHHRAMKAALHDTRAWKDLTALNQQLDADATMPRNSTRTVQKPRKSPFRRLLDLSGHDG